MKHIKKYIFLFFYLISLTIINSQVNIFSWSDDDYLKYSLNEFQDLQIINKKIVADSVDYPLFSACIFYATNLEREKYKRPIFLHSSALEKAAQKHSENMVDYNFYSHTSKVRGEKTMQDRLKLVGIENAYMAENIYNFFLIDPSYWSMAKGLVDGWMNSKGHRANILDKNQKYLGCGVKYYPNEEWPDYFHVKSTQNFSSDGGD